MEIYIYIFLLDCFRRVDFDGIPNAHKFVFCIMDISYEILKIKYRKLLI